MKRSFASLLLGTLIMAHSTVSSASVRELNLGILGGQNATQQIGDNMCVKSYFDKTLSVDTKLRNSSDYSGVIQGLVGGKIDMVLSMSPSAYASVYIRNPKAVDVMGILTDDHDESKGYHSVVVVRADSPYQKLTDLKGHSFGFADPDSTSGFLIPNHEFKKKFGGSKDSDYNHFFSSTTFSGGHEQDILGVLNGQFDGAVTWTSMVGDYNKGYSAGAFGRLMRMDHPDLMKKIRIIWHSPLIPNGPILVRHDLPSGFKAKLIKAIRDLDKNHHECWVKAVGGEQHITPATEKDYANIVELKRELMNGDR
ncbi:phosphonate ABC transporter substrate-binding protein [Vibrio salinus]|uniref:phosphonate ABC transporter substrate-binding protein n=1 Tax=Vibrio salinus TaxID=2899784 RepID=UPI001E310E54|nr:phosphonate ABC transporter substrate-binding protein [Vibrio salinus]MCE0495293.1 phosphonate ABC transporter substrate-binding protein [Vibrio salinus]